MTDEPKSLGALLFELPAVRCAKKVNTLSRVHRRLIEPIETEQDNEARLSLGLHKLADLTPVAAADFRNVLTQAEIARVTGVSRPTVTRIEGGRRLGEPRLVLVDPNM